MRSANRLPPEVLASCAAFVSDTDPRLIVPLTHVCRYWRRTISSNPRSWASIATAWKRLTPLCLERAGAVPLAVDITISDIKSDENFLKSLLPHTSKISHLRLAGYPRIEAVADNLPGFFDSPMLDLTFLELQQDVEPPESLPPSVAPVAPVFQNVSKLNSLRLVRTPLYPTLLNITSLKELKLLGYTSSFDFGTCIGLLRSNPELETIVLDIQFVTRPMKKRPIRKIPLSCLQHLSITCSKAIDSRGLLSWISLPRGVHVEVVSVHSDHSVSLSSFLPSPLTPICDLLAPITTIKTQLGRQELQLFGNGSSFTFRCSQFLLDLRSEFELFPTIHVRELQTSIRSHVFRDTSLSDAMKRLPALEILTISEATNFPDALVSALTEMPVLCPTLKTIALFDCGINSSTIKKLGEAITKRGESTAARLYRVVIITSTGTLPDLTSIKQLRKSVPCVEVRVDDKLPDLL